MESANKYKIIPLTQGSTEWLEYRRWKIGASDISAILGENNFKTAYQLYLEKIGEHVPFVTDAMRRGTLLEEHARVKANEIIGANYKPVCIESVTEDHMFCSLDGMDTEAEIKIIEIKCPTSIDGHSYAVNDKIPPYYLPQLQMQMYVADAEAAYYVSYLPDDIIPIAIVLVKRDNEMISRIIKEAKKFYEKMISFDPPELSSKDYRIVSDVALIELANERAQLKNECDDAMKRVDEIDAVLKGSVTDNSIVGPLKLIKASRRGTIDYAKVPELKTVDLEPYRKKTTVYWTIRQ